MCSTPLVVSAADITAGKLKFVPGTIESAASAYATFQFQVSDDTDYSATHTLTVDIDTVGIPANTAPSLAIGGTAVYTENAAAQTLLSSPLVLAITDDGNTLYQATVTISTGKVDGDVLAFVNATGMGNIAGVYNDGVLTLESADKSATLAQWTAALKAVTFASTSDNPGTSRTISWQLNDGTADGTATSNVGTTTIAVTPINDAPVATKVSD